MPVWNRVYSADRPMPVSSPCDHSCDADSAAEQRAVQVGLQAVGLHGRTAAQDQLPRGATGRPGSGSVLKNVPAQPLSVVGTFQPPTYRRPPSR